MAEKTPPPEGEEEEGGNVVEQHLPVTDLLEQWSLEVRQRDTGRRDKVKEILLISLIIIFFFLIL